MAALMLVAATPAATAGGILTNTNQSIDFLRNPARDAAIGLDGVYSNPAGVAFLPQGFHLGLNWQYAHQTRTITTTNPDFAQGSKNGDAQTKEFEGLADAPFIPSIQLAYNTGDWSLQFNFSVPGGGGKCEFEDGLGSFESVVAGIRRNLEPLGAERYNMDGYMQGRQYYFGFQLGSAYKINDKMSVYGGLRLLYGTATYRARISNIQVKVTGNGYVDFGTFLNSSTTKVDAGLTKVNGVIDQVSAGIAQYQSAGAQAPEALMTQLATLQAQKTQLEGTRANLDNLQKYSQGVNLLCNQTGVGVAPVVGIDYKPNDRFNFAAKYEFKTQIHMKNESTVFEASEIAAVNKFRDGEKVNEDQPALLTIGAQYSPLDDLRLNLGWHHFFDKDASWYNNTQKLLDHDTNEFLAGVEYDINDRLTLSLGGQLTRYGLSDDYMNDMSFVVNSYSIGFGVNYKLSKAVTLKAAYFQTNYETKDVDYTPAATDLNQTTHNAFTRTNRVLGIGCEITL